LSPWYVVQLPSTPPAEADTAEEGDEEQLAGGGGGDFFPELDADGTRTIYEVTPATATRAMIKTTRINLVLFFMTGVRTRENELRRSEPPFSRLSSS